MQFKQFSNMTSSVSPVLLSFLSIIYTEKIANKRLSHVICSAAVQIQNELAINLPVLRQ